jgi:hypothetical protein
MRGDSHNLSTLTLALSHQGRGNKPLLPQSMVLPPLPWRERVGVRGVAPFCRAGSASHEAGKRRALFEVRGNPRNVQVARLSCAAAPHWALPLEEISGGGCLLLWLLSFGQAKESDLLSGNPRLAFRMRKFR